MKNFVHNPNQLWAKKQRIQDSKPNDNKQSNALILGKKITNYQYVKNNQIDDYKPKSNSKLKTNLNRPTSSINRTKTLKSKTPSDKSGSRSNSSQRGKNNLKTKRKSVQFFRFQRSSSNSANSKSSRSQQGSLKQTLKKRNMKAIPQIIDKMKKRKNVKIASDRNNQEDGQGQTDIKTQRVKYEISPQIKKYIKYKKIKQQKEKINKALADKQRQRKIKQELNKLQDRRIQSLKKKQHLSKSIKIKKNLPLTQILSLQTFPVESQNCKSVSAPKIRIIHKSQLFNNKKTQLNKQCQIRNEACLTIQRYWRGYVCRQAYQKNLRKASIKTALIKQRMKKKQKFWYDQESSNSVIRLDQQIENDSERDNQQNKQLTRLYNGNKQLRLEKSQQRNVMEELRKKIEQNNQKYKMLQTQNQFLKTLCQKPNHILPLKVQNYRANIKRDEISDQQDYRTPVSYETSKSSEQMHIKIKQVESQLKEILSESEQIEDKNDIQSQQLSLKSSEIFQGPSPIKNLMSIQTENNFNSKDILSHKKLKLDQFSRGYRQIFENKSQKIQSRYKNSKLLLDRMLDQKLLSPKSYQAKQLMLEERIKVERNEIVKYKEKSRKVSQYINRIHNQQNQQSNKCIQINVKLGEESQTTSKNSPSIINRRENQDIQNESSIEISQFKQTYQFNQSNIEKEGFQSDLNFIGNYCIQFSNFIRRNPKYLDQFIQQMSRITKCNDIEFLKSYRTDLNNQNHSDYNSFIRQYLYVYHKVLIQSEGLLKHQWLTDFNQNQYFIKNKHNIGSHANLNSIFLEAIYDAFNESLVCQREESKLKRKKYYELKQVQKQQTLDMCLGKSINRVLGWAGSLCGLIPEGNEDQEIEIDQIKINELRQRRLALMLQKAIIDIQKEITNYQNQQIEVKLFLTQRILSFLINQLLSQIKHQ